jgi:phage regulator Rha-like protein
MNLPMMAAGQGPITMSSREIAELVEKRHDNVKRTIDSLAERGVITVPQIEETPTPGGGKATTVYHLGKRDTLVVVAQLSPEFTARVVDRWQELEAQRTPAILTGPQLLAAALIEANATLQVQTRQIEAMRDDVAALERIAKADGSLSVTEAAKNLGLRPKDLFDWLSRNGWIYRRAGSSFWLGYQPKCNQGLLEHKSTTVLRADGSEKISEQVRITPKGLSALAKAMPPTTLPLGGDK